MTIRPLGYEGVQRRISEIRQRMEEKLGREADDRPTVLGGAPPSLAGSLDAGNRPLSPLGPGVSTVPVQPPPALQGLIERVASETGVDPGLFTSLVANESGFNPRAVSSKGAIGLTQLMPLTAQGLGVSDPYDPEQNLRAGARYLAQMLRQFGNDEALALAAYNAGPQAVIRAGRAIPQNGATPLYVQRVLAAAGRRP